MPNELQAQFDAALAQAQAIADGVKATGGEWTKEIVEKYDTAIKSATAIKGRISSEKALSDLQDWRNAPDGGSAVRAGFTQGLNDDSAAIPMEMGNTVDGIMAQEGNLPGVTMEPLLTYSDGPNGQKSVKVGELIPFTKAGEKRIATLKSGGYKDAFATHLRMKAFHGGDWPHYMKAAAMKVLQEGQDTAGGFWVPPDIRTELVKKMASVIGIRANAYSFSTGSNLVQFPKVVYNTGASDTNGQIFTAGTQPSWTAEAPIADISEGTNPVSGHVNIPVQTATVAIIITRAMIEDAMFDLLGYISQLLGESYGLFEDNAFINGSGANQPQGILNHPNATTASSALNAATGSYGMYVPSGTSAALAWEGASNDATKGLLGVEAALPPQYDGGAKWYASKATFAGVRGLTDTQGRPLWSIGESYPSFQNGYNAALLGAPIVKDQFVPTMGASTYSVIYGDMQGYYIPDRVGLSVEVLREVRALRDEIVIYARKRVGGQLVQDWRLKTLKLASS